MRFLGFFAIVTMGCGASVVSGAANDGGTDSNPVVVVDASDRPDVPGRPDAPGPTPPCTVTDPANPPIGCGPVEDGASTCSSIAAVSTCPMDNACMAQVKQSGSVLSHRAGRLRLWEPMSLVSLATIAIDPNVNAKCANSGSEGLSWLLRIEHSTNTLFTGTARPSTDGRTFSFARGPVDPSAYSAACPGFRPPSTTPLLGELKVAMAKSGTGFVADGAGQTLNLAIYDPSGLPIVLPLRDPLIRVPTQPDPSCIGSWDPNYWCDGNTLGWKTGGSIVAKISVEEANYMPIKSAGCQSLCAILANDATKTDPTTRSCKLGPDGKVPPIGNACIGGAGCNNAWLFSATFGSYGVTITP